MNEFFGEDREESPLGIIPSAYGNREEILAEFRSAKRLLWGILVAIVLTFGGVVLLTGDRELIVALSSDGHMQVLSPLSDQVYEKNFQKIARYFVTDFLRNLTAYDSFEVSYRLEKALSVMTPALRTRMKQEIVAQNLLDGVSRAQIHTLLTIKTFTLKRVTSGVWSLETEGTRSTYPYGQGVPTTRNFSSRLLLKKGAPTAFNPYGLWVSRYQEKSDSPRPEGRP